MEVQPTSLKAYFEEVLPTLGNRHKQVLEVLIKHKDMTNMELANQLDWSINRITPRVKELRKKDIVVQSQVRECKITRRNVIAWKFNKFYYLNKLKPEVKERAIKQRTQPSLI